MANLAPAPVFGWGFSLRGSQVACCPQATMPGEGHMAGLLAVGIAILLAIVISVSYALVLRELRQINANLEQLIGLLAEAGRP